MKRTEAETEAVTRLRFTPTGVRWLATAAIVGAVSWFKSINLVLLVVYAMAGLLVLNGVWAWIAVRRTAARRVPLPPVFAGERSVCEVTVSNGATHAVTVTAEDRAGGVATAFLVYRLPAGRTLPCTAFRTFSTRGRFGGALVLTSGFPFGLLECERPGDAGGEIVVLPRPGIADPTGLRRWVLRGGGDDAHARRVLRRVSTDQAEVRGVRPYRPGDAVRDVHWRTTARRGEPVVREYDAAPSPGLVLVVEAWLPPDPDATARARLEAALSLAVTIATTWRGAFDSPVTVVVPGPVPTVMTAGSEDDLRGALAPLADLEGGPAPNAIPAGAFRRHLKSGARLVVSSRSNTPYAPALARSTGKPFVAVSPEDHLPWYQPPVPMSDSK